jgi:hypothetical protein
MQVKKIPAEPDVVAVLSLPLLLPACARGATYRTFNFRDRDFHLQKVAEMETPCLHLVDS